MTIYPPNCAFWLMDVGLAERIREPHFPGSAFSLCIHDAQYRACDKCAGAWAVYVELRDAYYELQTILLTIGWLFGAT